MPAWSHNALAKLDVSPRLFSVTALAAAFFCRFLAAFVAARLVAQGSVASAVDGVFKASGAFVGRSKKKNHSFEFFKKEIIHLNSSKRKSFI